MSNEIKDKIILESFIVPSDYSILRNYFLYRSKTVRTRFFVYTTICSFALLLLSGFKFAFPFFKPLGIFGFLMVAVIYYLIDRDSRRLTKSVKFMINRKQELQLSDDGITVKWKGLEPIEYKWADVFSAVETDYHFFLFVDQYFALIIQKIEMKEPKKKQVRDLIESKIKLVTDFSGYKPKKV